MSTPPPVPSFAVVPGAEVARVLRDREKRVVEIVEAAYRAHGAGRSVNPPSYFLRFPDRPSSRIIALPASLGGDTRVDGIKWISSFPENLTRGIPRASAVLILNDPTTGYPFACLEGSIISAARTAASAALAADRLGGGPRPVRIGYVGTGLIARYVHSYLVATGWTFDRVGVRDLDPVNVDGFRSSLARTGGGDRVVAHADAESLVRESELLVFATTAATPHVTDPGWFAHRPLVLHVSLRDLAPEVIRASTNIVDDVEHCLKANTSVHLAEQQTGRRDFLAGTLHDVMTGRVAVTGDRPVVFSPFGLGVLDLAVGGFVYDEVSRAGGLTLVDGFFHEMRRYG
ncbi:MAG TPA: 2,3-diaminopropionate biosynthesis protein SbnB [Pilimelia sp.]|nr:2,3-diaminopropionate biosynthesis protein SbnB [Pilimelia sp.]